MRNQTKVVISLLFILIVCAFTFVDTKVFSGQISQHPGNRMESTSTPCADSKPDRSKYLEIDVQKALIDRDTRIKMDEQYLRDTGKPNPYVDIHDTNVYDVALNLAGYPNLDGYQPDRVTIEFSGNDQAVAIIFDEKLLDDSIFAHEYRIELYHKESIWKISQAGVRYQCSRGTFSGWTTELCP